MRGRVLGRRRGYLLRLATAVRSVESWARSRAPREGSAGPWSDARITYGSKSRRGTEVAAVFYTLLETAKLAGGNPAEYLREAALANARDDVLLPTDYRRASRKDLLS